MREDKLAFASVFKALDKVNQEQLNKLGSIERLLKKNSKTVGQVQTVKGRAKKSGDQRTKTSVKKARPYSENRTPASSQLTTSKTTKVISNGDNKIAKDSDFSEPQHSNDAMQETNDLLRGLWRDANGILRQQNGAFASKQQQEAFKSSDSDSDSESNNGVLSAISKILSKTQKHETAVEFAGKAIGGSFWTAAVEVKDLVERTKDTIGADQDTGMLSALKTSFKDKVAEKKEQLASIPIFSKFFESKQKKTPHDQTSSSKALANNKQEQFESKSDDEFAKTYVDWQQRVIEAIEENRTVVNGVDGSGFDLAGDLLGGKRKVKFKGMSSVLDGAKTAGKGAKSMLGSSIAKIALPLTALVAGVSKYNDIKDKEELSTAQKTAQVGATATGALGGAAAGVAAGAAIGSVVPVVGTVIGGLIGGAIGAWAGEKGGEVIGEAISDKLKPDEIIDKSDANTSNVNHVATKVEKSASKLADAEVAGGTAIPSTTKITSNQEPVATAVSKPITPALSAPIKQPIKVDKAPEKIPSPSSEFVRTSLVETTKKESVPQKPEDKGNNKELTKAINLLVKTMKEKEKAPRRIIKEVASHATSSVETVPSGLTDDVLKLITSDLR